MQDLATCKDQSERISHAITKIQEASSDQHILEDLINSAKSLISRIKASYHYKVESMLLGDVTFLKASHVSSVMKANQLEEDYGLKKVICMDLYCYFLHFSINVDRFATALW